MGIKELLTLLPGIIKFGSSIIKGFKKAKEDKHEKEYVEAVRSGNIESINRILHS